MLPQRISFQPSVGRSIPSGLRRAVPGHWQLRELAGAYANWGVMGRFRPFERPLWSTFIWRLEFGNAINDFLLTPLRGQRSLSPTELVHLRSELCKPCSSMLSQHPD